MRRFTRLTNGFSKKLDNHSAAVAFQAMMHRTDRQKGFFVSFDYSRDALSEIDAFFRKSGRIIIPLTVREILDEQIARKLA